MIPQTFSLEMCQHLSSLAPGFEGHWYYVEDENKNLLMLCREDIDWQYSEMSINYKEICPAWQVEDVLRNINLIEEKIGTIQAHEHAERIVWYFAAFPDTAYQKIEEYIWTVLK